MIIGDGIDADILAPIADGPGIDGRADEGEVGDLFREIRFQRKAIFRIEQKAAMGEDVGDGDNWSWDQIAETAVDYLKEHGKDLEIMAILVESCARRDGLAGFDRAVMVMSELVETWWDQGLYPAEDEEDGVEARFQPLSGLSGGGSDKDGTLIGPLRNLVLAGGGDESLRYMDRVVAEGMLASAQTVKPEQRASLQAQDEEAMAASEALAKRVGGKPLRIAVVHLSSAEAAWRRTVSFISERTKPRFPAASRVSDELRSIREWLEGLLRLLPDDSANDVEDPPENVVDATGDGAVVVAGGAANAPFSIGKITRREDALRAVNAAADYFEKYEPISPIGSALRDVDRRARMSFDDLLVELIPDGSSRELFYWRSGIRPPPE